jgi:hypothetical protein
VLSMMSNKLFTGVNDTGYKLLPVLVLPVINYCLVPDIHRFHDTSD